MIGPRRRAYRGVRQLREESIPIMGHPAKA
jgi:hypothetical protein